MDRFVVRVVSVIEVHVMGSLMLGIVGVGELWGVLVLDGLVRVMRHCVVVLIHGWLLVHSRVVDWLLVHC